ncbi:hypothetical protein AAG906_018916 [Vitis piasezkii]
MICCASSMAQLLVLLKPSCNLVLQCLSPIPSASYGNDRIVSFSMPFLHQSHGLLPHLSPLQQLLMKHDEIILHVLNGLGNDFKEINAAIRARDSLVTFEELHDKLQDQETLLKQDDTRWKLHQSRLVSLQIL